MIQDFQQKEKVEGYIRHCGPYIVEIFKVFEKLISDGKNVKSDDEETGENEVNVTAALSAIFCGEAENIGEIRQSHIVEFATGLL